MASSRKIRRARRLVCATTLALGAAALVPAAAGADSGQEAGVGADSTTPLVTFSSGQDGGTRAIVSTHGNLTSLEGPFGYDHLAAGSLSEGYVLCYTGPGGAVNAYDMGGFEFGFNAPTTTSSSPTSAIIIRTTSDGVLQLRQQFSFRGVEKRIVIQNTIKNLTTGGVSDVILRRQADFDIDTGGTNAWASFNNWHASTTVDSYMAWNDPADAPVGFTAHGAVLRAMRGGQSRAAGMTPGILTTTCSPTLTTTPTGPSDMGGTVQFNLGGIPAGQAKSAKVDYTRI